MRIAYLINQYPKVSHTFIRREILALERQGFEITRISVRGHDNDLVDNADLAEREKTKYVLQSGWRALVAATLNTAISRPRRFARALALAMRMSRRADRPLPYHLVYLIEASLILQWLVKANVKHLHTHFGTNSAEVAMLVNALSGLPWSFTVHGPEEFDKPNFIGLPEKIRRANFVVAISSYTRSQLFRLVDHTRWKTVHVVHCGLEAGYFENTPTYSESKHLVCVGRLCEQKGQLLLIEAARQLSSSGVDFSLTLAGDGELRADIEALIENYGLESKIRVTGWISNDAVRQCILEARALVLPSFAEGLPVVIMEAMALRRPVISTYVAGIPELVQDGKHGWLVPAGDVDALTDAMRQCLEAPLAGIHAMGDAARDRALLRHCVDAESAKLGLLLKPM